MRPLWSRRGWVLRTAGAGQLCGLQCLGIVVVPPTHTVSHLQRDGDAVTGLQREMSLTSGSSSPQTLPELPALNKVPASPPPSLPVSFFPPHPASRLRGRLSGLGMHGSKCVQREKLDFQWWSKAKSSGSRITEAVTPQFLSSWRPGDPEHTHEMWHNDTGIRSDTVQADTACGGSEKHWLWKNLLELSGHLSKQ